MHSYYNKETEETKSCEHQKLENLWRFTKPPQNIVDLLHLFQDGIITSTDLLLLPIIDSLATAREPNEKKFGCYASNEYLAKAVGKVHKKYISTRISQLQKLGLLLVFYVNGQRYLETIWTRSTEDRDSLSGEYGENCRESAKGARKLKKSKNWYGNEVVNIINDNGGVQENMDGGVQENMDGGVQENMDLYNKDKYDTYRKNDKYKSADSEHISTDASRRQPASRDCTRARKCSSDEELITTNGSMHHSSKRNSPPNKNNISNNSAPQCTDEHDDDYIVDVYGVDPEADADWDRWVDEITESDPERRKPDHLIVPPKHARTVTTEEIQARNGHHSNSPNGYDSTPKNGDSSQYASPSTNGHSNGHVNGHSSKNGKKLHPRFFDWANLFIDATQKKQKKRLKRDKFQYRWAREFYNILDEYYDDIERIEKVLNYYCLNKVKINKDEELIFNCPKHFANNLVWLEQIMQREDAKMWDRSNKLDPPIRRLRDDECW